MNTVEFIDSHTAGEPTRVIVSGGPDVGTGPLHERVERLSREFDGFRTMSILEPRGSEALVGALLCQPFHADCITGVIFFNNRGSLGMCGHGTMGLAVTLARMGRVDCGVFQIDTPVGAVEVELQTESRVTIRNVPAYRFRKEVAVDVPQLGPLIGDIAWGGNWFYLVKESPLPLTIDNIPLLTDATKRVLAALHAQCIAGADGAMIDHVEFFGPAHSSEADSRNFVLCPGGEYDRSPCGTGTSAKLACLAADGELEPGELWVQEGILGTCFLGRYERLDNDRISPTISGDAFVTAEGRLLVHPQDPFRLGIRTEIGL